MTCVWFQFFYYFKLFSLGLYHGKDVRFGHTISHSHTRAKKKWHPNVIHKNVWSEALDDWVRFKMTAKALKAIDNIGGIDNYMLSLDEVSIGDSKHNSRVRDLIASTLFYNGTLPEKIIKRLKYDKVAPMRPEEIKETRFPKPVPRPKALGAGMRETKQLV